ncbi:MAG TPA: substrate-binding domain-containing protein [Kofleriaceae bacterium]|nr:substrate-binding domain-containing protein [Kofleriaceae bacterium]
MTNRKRAVITGVLLSMSASLALATGACSKDSDRGKKDKEKAAPAEPTTPVEPANDKAGAGPTGRKIKIAFSAPAADHGWTGAISTNAKAQAAKFDDVEFSLTQAATAADQVSQLNTIMLQKPDVLVILPQDETVTPAALAAMKAGIAVINVDREFSDPAAQRAVIKGDNYGVGFQAGQYFAKELKCKGNVVEIQGIAGISVTNQRTKGFADAIKQCKGGIKIVAQQPADFAPDKGLSVMQNILQAQSKIDAVYTHDDDMAQGVVQAIKNANRDKEMWLTGVGGSKAAMDLIKQGGLYRATFLYNPSMAASAVALARLLARNEGLSDLVEPVIPSLIVMQAQGVFQDNVDQFTKLGF